jgi:hypothetical protein
MPSVSKKQHNFMEAIAHSPEFAKKAGVPQSVGKDFASADKGKKFSFGGKAMINKRDTRHGKIDMPNANLSKYIGMKRGGEMKESKAMVKKEVSFFKKKGAPASMIKHEKAEMKGMKHGGMAGGGMPMKDGKPAFIGDGKGAMKKGGMADGGMAMRKGMPSRGMRPQMGAGMPPRGMPPRMMRPPAPASDMAAPGMRKGGMPKRSEKDVAKDQQDMSNMATYARGGGIESRGKTKGTMVKMAEGGVVKFARGGGIESRGKTRGKMC